MAFDGLEFIIQLFTAGIKRFRATEKGEDLLRVHVRYLKYLISIQYPQEKIEKLFKVGMISGIPQIGYFFDYP